MFDKIDIVLPIPPLHIVDIAIINLTMIVNIAMKEGLSNIMLIRLSLIECIVIEFLLNEYVSSALNMIQLIKQYH